MITNSLAYLARWRKNRRLLRKRDKRFARWLAVNPDGTYGQFYAEDARRRIEAGHPHQTLGVSTVDQDAVKARAQRVLEDFKRAGCRPQHVVVDYGCGSLWIGEAFMEYLEPERYVGLDVSDTFYTEALARMPSAFVADRKPTVRSISDAALKEIRGRNPDFILSIAVMHHVPPKDLRGYLGRIVSMAAPHTRIEISHAVGLYTRHRSPRTWRHSRYAIGAALAPLGYVADYRAESRIMRSTPGFALIRH